MKTKILGLFVRTYEEKNTEFGLTLFWLIQEKEYFSAVVCYGYMLL